MVGAHPGVRAHAQRSGKCDSEVAGAEEEKTGNGYSEETVRSDFFMCHGTPTYRSAMLVATCNRLFQISSETRQLRLMAQLYVGTRPIPKGIERIIRRFVGVCLSRPIILDVGDDLHKWTCTFVAISLAGAMRGLVVRHSARRSALQA
jgi:hypothetical protein